MKNIDKEENGIIFDIQRYSIHDGPGIRTIVFLKGCPLACPWCSNPESQKTAPEIEYSAVDCLRCRRCITACPRQALTESNDEIRIDRRRCDMCGECLKVCAAEALRFVGKGMTVSQVMAVVEKDKVFYQKSGGGITLSGGEPLMQPQFSAALLARCKSQDIHTAIETTGFQVWDKMWPVIQKADVVLLDIKLWDSLRHYEIVGVTNKLILENTKKMVDSGKQVIIRVPIIPGYNDRVEELKEIATFARRIGVKELNLLPYHRLGEAKYRRLGREYQLNEVKVPTVEEIEAVAKQLQIADLKIQVGG